MYAGRVACYPLVSHIEYASRALLRLEKRRDRQTDGRYTVTLRALLPSFSSFPFPHPHCTDIACTGAIANWAFMLQRRRLLSALTAIRHRGCCFQPTAHCNKSHDPVNLLEKLRLRCKLRPMFCQYISQPRTGYGAVMGRESCVDFGAI